MKQKTTLKRKTPLKQKTKLRTYSRLQQKTSLKCKQKTAKKLNEPYFSIFTDDMNKCVITGDKNNVVPHHIFDGSRKTLSEKYGFIIPLRTDWHTVSNYSIHMDRNLALYYMVQCQDYYINVLKKSKEDWLKEFNQWWELPKEAVI